MSLISTLARLEAVREGRARPLATVRHRHLAARPVVFVPLTTAGETGAPLGAMVGTDRRAPRLLVVPQPRDRDLRSAFLAELAEVMLPLVEEFGDVVEPELRKETDPETGEKVTVEVELCADAPQLLVPGAAGVEYVRLLGRSMRFRRTAEQEPEAPHPAPPRVPLLGRWLTHFGERARVPGSSLLLAMTQLLGRHWATGQSVLEDQHLGALLAWIDPPAGLSAPEAALRAELARHPDGQLVHPPAGPATDPAFDNALLAPALARHDAGVPGAGEEIRSLLEAQLRPTWDAVWQGVDLLRALPEGAHVAERWKRDRWSYTAHRDRVRAGEPPQPRRDDAVTAARKLAAREGAQAQLDAQEALDDPLVMAARRLAGEAFAGEVTAVVMEYSQAKVPRPRPLVTVRTEDAPHLSEGVKLHRALPDGRSQPAEFVGPAESGPGGAGLTVRLTGGMGRGREPDPGTVPEPGDRVCWTLFEHAPRGGPELPGPERTPWTHGGPPAAPDDTPDPVTAEDHL
ncbi:hypothetical protein BLA24_20000 [Streptomyces cinnamoneus]|uniref:Uncharacterized protein n=1 Tax=Streptomyces cinnamoneus TaxID=53446 RepID=A0A2G1XF99_STRCJ|nr:hypothetical protein [Streptomyces cinnamoneus]PHQ49914.1 hypothetical protein BLA24_20000 [Streptomyces cinnamoneus]PPT13311.1 hypothetical protein CYQ11_10790 [Streptomyces cinnamoneus]